MTDDSPCRRQMVGSLQHTSAHCFYFPDWEEDSRPESGLGNTTKRVWYELCSVDSHGQENRKKRAGVRMTIVGHVGDISADDFIGPLKKFQDVFHTRLNKPQALVQHELSLSFQDWKKDTHHAVRGFVSQLWYFHRSLSPVLLLLKRLNT